MKTKIIFTSLIVLAIAVVGIVVFFISRPQPEELLPQKFAELPEKPKLIATFHHGTTSKSDMNHSYDISLRTNEEIYSVAISPVDASLMASVNGAGTIKLWNTNNTIEPIKLLKHPGILTSIGFSPTGELLVSADYENAVLWDVASGTKLKALKTSNRQFAFTPDGNQLATISKGVKLWDIQNPKQAKAVATLPYDAAISVNSSPCAIDISSDGQWIAVGHINGTVNVWDMQTQQLLKTLKTSMHLMDYVKFSPNKKYMVCVGHEEDMYSTHSVKGFIMWDTASWQPKGQVLRGDVKNLVFSPNGKMCVSTNDFYLYGRGLEIWSTANGAPMASIQTEAKDVSFSQDGSVLATGGTRGTIRLWKLPVQQLDSDGIRNDVVKLVYFLPKGKEPSPNITQRIDKLIRKVQKFYADEMERHGFGRKTFTFETNEDGKAKIYRRRDGQFYNHDIQLNDIWLVFADDRKEVSSMVMANVEKLLASRPLPRPYNETFVFPTSRNIIVKDKISMYDIKGSVGKGSFIFATKKRYDWRLTAYTLKDMFSVFGKDHRLNKYEKNAFKRFFKGINKRMPWGKGWVKLSKCEAEWLDKSRFFNSYQSFFDKRPEIEMDVLKADTDSPIFQFMAADEDGIHQLQLFVPEDLEIQAWIDRFQGCQTLNGKKKGTIEFEISNPEIKTGEIRMIDMLGNIASREFLIIKKESEPSKDP